ncbi:erythromycin esterase-domain-containing protein [Hysterangium stoloniferum]|nr:erythromycin esterase-domain-containing protein [Hysterangium stoloniferum]
MPTQTAELPASIIRNAVVSLPDLTEKNFAQVFDTFITDKTQIVLLGEASHGTSEFYRARAAITKRLIEEHGFTILAVEADWPDSAKVDRWVRHKNDPVTAGTYKVDPFKRFPSWMWQNTDAKEFFVWLRAHNRSLPHEKRAGFYGLDLYNLSASMRGVIDYLTRVDPAAAILAKKRYGCLSPWATDPALYGMASLSAGYAQCEEEVVRVQMDLLKKEAQYRADHADGEEFLNAEQNARLVTDAERYYRAMYYGSAESWNLRDTHFFETLENLLLAKGPPSRAVVWAHNSHIGDARFTSMGTLRDELNLGQLCREHYGDAVSIIGFGTHTGTVAAAEEWDEPMQTMKVVPSRDDSYEWVFHNTGVPRCMIDLRDPTAESTRQLMKTRKERFIGVIYRPATEIWSHYSDAVLPKQFDGYVWFDRTNALTPLAVKEKRDPKHTGYEETYPFGL